MDYQPISCERPSRHLDRDSGFLEFVKVGRWEDGRILLGKVSRLSMWNALLEGDGIGGIWGKNKRRIQDGRLERSSHP
jgi:hypothetical protein